MNPREVRIQRAFFVPVMVAALLVIPVIVIEHSHPNGAWRTGAYVANWIIWSVFAAELVARLAVTRGRVRWLVRHPLEVAIVVFTPPFLPASLQVARVVRVMQVLRVLRLAKLARRWSALQGLRYAGVLTLLTILGGGALFADLEHHTTWDGVWWAATTMTTLGSDIQAHTNGGRVLTLVILAVGFGFVATLTAAFAQRFILEETEEAVEAGEADIVAELRAIRAQVDRLEGRIRS